MKKWYKNIDIAERDAAKEHCQIVLGHNRYTDIYYLVPINSEKSKIFRVIGRSQTDCHGKRRYRVIYISGDSSPFVVEETTKYRIQNVKLGKVAEEKVYNYLNGYYTLNEERSEKIRERKERARISHILNDTPGKKGHDERQVIRRELMRHGI